MPKQFASLLLKSPRQRGVMTMLTVFIMLIAVGALAVLGLGQVVWQKEEVQRIADLAAKAAASGIDSQPQGFPAAFDYARENGYNESTDTLTIICNVRGTNNPVPGGGCESSVLVRMERSVPAAFLGIEPVVAVAEATVTPFISGIVGTNLLSANLNAGVLSPLLQQIGVKFSLGVGFANLLQSDLQVDLQQLATNLSVPGSNNGLDLEALLAAPVTARSLLTQAAVAAGLPGPGLGSMNDPALNTQFPLGDIISADQAIEANLPAASVRLGNLAFAAILSAATFLPQNTLQVNLGDTVRVSVIEPPQLFIAVKRDNTGGILGTARTEQIRVTTKINGVVDLNLTAGGGEVDIRDIECRLPQSDSAVVSDLTSSAVNASVDLPSLPSVLGAPGIVLVPGQDPAAIAAGLAVESASAERFEGYPDPVLEARYSFEASQGLPELLNKIDLGLAPLNSLLTVLNVNSPVKVALSQLGTRLDSILDLLGLGVNEVVVQIDNMDCFNTAVLTR